VAIVLVYMLCNVAHIRYFWRVPGRSAFTHVVVPVLSIVALAYPLYSVAAPDQLYPYNLVPLIVGVWLIAGLALHYYYRVTSPEKIAAIGAFTTADDLPPGDHERPFDGAYRGDPAATGS